MVGGAHYAFGGMTGGGGDGGDGVAPFGGGRTDIYTAVCLYSIRIVVCTELDALGVMYRDMCYISCAVGSQKYGRAVEHAAHIPIHRTLMCEVPVCGSAGCGGTG